MHGRQVLVNAVMSVLQVVVLTGVFLLLYRYMLGALGVAQLGIWSLVTAISGPARVGDLGLSSSVVKFVAKYAARHEEQKVAQTIQVALVLVAVFVGLLALAAFPVLKWLLSRVLSGGDMERAFSILPYTLVAFWIMAIAGVLLSALDGYQRMDLRSAVFIGAGVLFLLLSADLVPRYGLLGVVYAQILQAAVLLVAGGALLSRRVSYIRGGLRWSRALVRELIGYSLNFQAASLATVLYDPITKSLMSLFGGLSAVGYYEMASRMILQLRALMVAASQALVPAIADMHERDPGRVDVIYGDLFRLLVYIAVPAFSLLVAALPLVSEIWIGRYEELFVALAALLAAAWLVNTLSVPAYFSNLGTGHLRWNTISHIMIGVFNAAFGLVLGWLYGGVGVVVGWTAALAVGSLPLLIAYNAEHRISVIELIPKQTYVVALACLGGLIIGLTIYFGLRPLAGLAVTANLCVLAFAGVVAVPVWTHPMRRRLAEWVAEAFEAKAS